MSNDSVYLPLLLDGPLQSWGHQSRFQRRTTALYPTKSAVAGMICAAMGLRKGSAQEQQRLAALRASLMHVVDLPRPNWRVSAPHPGRRSDWLQPRRMEDYHTVGGGFDRASRPYSAPWTASGRPDEDATVTRREYLLDARFGVILAGVPEVLVEAATALRDPVWGIWLGRKACVPASPVVAADPSPSPTDAWGALLGAACLPSEIPYGAFGGIEEVVPGEGHVTIMDQPVSFGDGKSSGPDVRRFAARHIRAIGPRGETAVPES